MPEAIRIRRFVVLNKEFDADDDEITRTRKIRRRFVGEKYAAIVDAFYSGAAEVEVSAAITYEDGRKSVLRSTIAIGDVEAPAAGARGGVMLDVPWRFIAILVANGVLVGSMYALVALGFVLIYKATDAINFAQGEFVMFAGFSRRRQSASPGCHGGPACSRRSPA